MTYLVEVLALLAFRERALRALSSHRRNVLGMLVFAAGFGAHALIRWHVYAGLVEAPVVDGSGRGILAAGLEMNLLQALAFAALAYVPTLLALSNGVAGDGLGFTFSKAEYQTQLAAYLPLWGMVFLVSGLVQLVLPQIYVIDPGGVSIGASPGRLMLILLFGCYTVWAIRTLNYVSSVASIGVFAVSWIILPLFYLLTSFMLALPFFILIPLVWVIIQKVKDSVAAHESELALKRNLQSLTVNPRDADAQYQLGLLHLNRGRMEPARQYFETAVGIDPNHADYRYALGRALERDGNWQRALAEYSAVYRLEPDYGQGDIQREVGKAYLHTGETGKAAEFLNFYLNMRGSDPEARYWLAAILGRQGKPDEMRTQLLTILEQARSHPRFYRKDKRDWIFRARTLLRGGQNPVS